MNIRHADHADCAAIAEIYNHAVRFTAAIWNDKIVDSDNRVQWMTQRQARHFPVIVALQDDQVVGYASYGDWRAFDGYRHTVEHSVYVHPDHQGKGIGQQLMAALIDIARERGVHVMIAGIETGNSGSVHLHHKLGFVITGQMPQVGTKFGRWLDLTFMQLQLDDRRDPDGAHE